MRYNRSTLWRNTNICLQVVMWYSARGGSRRAVWMTILAVVWVILYTPSINAQQKRSEPQQERPAAQSSSSEPGNISVIAGANEDYRISAGDVIEIKIEDAPELSHNYRVNSSGQIEMQVLGLIEAQQQTTYELGRLITRRLIDEEYLKNPNVQVTIKQYFSQTFIIQGSVRNPGVYQTEGRPSLLTIIGLAGGLTGDHGSTVFILRPIKLQKPEPDYQISSLQDQTADQDQTSNSQTGDPGSTPSADYELIQANVNALFKGLQNHRLEPGDIVNIPRADIFFVAGEVKAPGSFTLKEGTTLRQAISLAQGMTFSAKSTKGIIFRENPTIGTRQEIKVDIRAVMDGKKEDIPIRANDVIIIPNSRTKSVGAMLLMALGVNSARLPVPQ